ncbi:DEAD/DEAH box helicase [Emergencia sp.]|uniref:DEAD/DEAH box helicase n=1 Tax=Emergencia sp. TaxID=1926557 RepID=UPI003AEF6E30
MEPLARSSATTGTNAQPYQTHIKGVLKKVIDNLKRITPFTNLERAEYHNRILKRAALTHDLGKLADQNQNALRKSQKGKRQPLPIDHRDAGVKYLLGCQSENPEAVMVYAHHPPGLPNLPAEILSAHPYRSSDAMTREDSEQNLQRYVELHTSVVGTIPEPCSSKKLSAMEYRILLSCLVDADYSDAANVSPVRIDTRWKERLDKLKEYTADLQKQEGNSERNHLRKLLFEACLQASVKDSMTYCDSPVGTGKTTAVMAHMLKVASTYDLRHIFIVLPYTNIISQTVKILREALVLNGENPQSIVAEHHHQADFESHELQHLATTWQAPIIVTTSVQFFETLSSSHPAKLRKLHQLAGSGIIFDESHSLLPMKLWPVSWSWLSDFTTKWGGHVCFCSGTMIKFWENHWLVKRSEIEVKSLLPDEVIAELNQAEENRILLDIRDKKEISHFQNTEKLAEHIAQYFGSKVVVLNTVYSAAYFAYYLRQSGKDVLHLSTALSPEDREAVIEEVKHRLSLGEAAGDWILVATSIIECGMDLSFHYGFCEWRSLASYIQLSGRVGRNFEYEDSFLSLFSITDDHITSNPWVRNTQQIFYRMIEEGLLSKESITEAISEAFANEYKLDPTASALADLLYKAERQRNFKDVDAQYNVIEDEKRITAIVNPEIAARIKAGKYITATELQRGSVNIRSSLLEKLGIEMSELPILNEKQYDSFIGYMKSLI